MEGDHADTYRRRIRNDHRANEIQRRHDRAQQRDENEQHHDHGEHDDESQIMVVVVADVVVHRRQSGHRDGRIRECCVGLRATGRLLDGADLIHRLGAEGVQVALHQVAHRMSVR
ncbi:Uncharacterised protein [Mycobacteroides abscessus subsp. massiliense]|nr:Uncharacterised protein [Mycobacteroides abscessus subsp. massiliense]